MMISDGYCDKPIHDAPICMKTDMFKQEKERVAIKKSTMCSQCAETTNCSLQTELN